jgi:uncharacterized protein YcfJ
MTRSSQVRAAALLLTLASSATLAGENDYAAVVNVEPLRREVRVSEPVRECWQEALPASRGPFSYGHVGGTLVGSAIGVAVGNQIGRGSGKDVARIAGALIGGAIGHNVSVDRQRQLGRDGTQPVERCDVRYRDRFEERIDGYEVTYEYAGREYVTRLPYDPGERIRVRVDVTPVDG